MIRVVAGSAKGRKLVAPTGTDVRPTTDRVREAVFNALYSMGDPVDGATVVDLFAGSGALGIEALSRGASTVTFVERDRAALAAIEQNLRTTGLGDRATVVRADALDWLERVTSEFDLALCDPPYAFDDWPRVLNGLRAALAVLETDKAIETGPAWDVIRSRHYGGTVVSIVQRRALA